MRKFSIGYGQGKLWWHQVVILGVLLLFTLWRLLLGNWSFSVNILWWWLGGIIGFLFVFTDRLVYSLVADSGDVMGERVKDLWQNGRLSEGLKLLLMEREEPKKLAMRSGLFVGVWLILGLWTMVGVLNPFARGLMLGIGVHLLFDLLWDYLDKTRGVEHWFWQIKRPMSRNEIRGFVWVAVVVGLVIVKNL